MKPKHPNCDLCARPAAVEVDVRHHLVWGGRSTRTWIVCTPHRDVLAARVDRLGPGWVVADEREVKP